MATGLVIGGAAAFNRYWAGTIVGRPDIGARGGFVLLVVFPIIFAGVVVVTCSVFALLTRRIALAGWERVGMPLSAAGSAMAVSILVVLARSFLPLSLRTAAWLTPGVALGCLSGGYVLAWRATRPRAAEIATLAT
jgi:hypothetical protein